MRNLLAEIRAHLKDHPWLISMIFHTAALLVMGLWVFPDWMDRKGQLITASFADLGDQESSFSLMPIAAIEMPDLGDSDLKDEPVETSLTSELTEMDLPELLPSAEGVEASALEKLLPTPETRLASLRTLMTEVGGDEITDRSESTAEQVGTADGIESATQAVENAIRGELKQGDTLVVWLLDASISLQLNRDRMARRIREFYDEIGALSRPATSDGVEQHRLFSSVVAFGKGIREVSRPSLIGVNAIDAMTRVPVDKSGVENTMAAVDGVLDHYRYKQRRKERLMVVLLTDESGDDVQKLEYTIANCRQAEAVVHVLGPTAVMGMQKGLQRWTAPAAGGGAEYFLTVDRGPESAVPQRIFLPYWHEADVPLKNVKMQPVSAMPWSGSAYRERVLSGFGPYALTRLALQTGGTFTLYDDGVSEQYDVEKLRQYMPSYRSVTDVRLSVQDSLLRSLVVQAADWTMREKQQLAAPRMLFMGTRSPTNPTQFTAIYVTPAEFRSRFSVVVKTERSRSEKALKALNQLLEDSQTSDWRALLEGEESARWRAAFSLARGRLLASMARYHEYIAACERAKDAIQSDTNMLNFMPSSRMNTSPGAALAEHATQVLSECVSEHRGTPWAELANWELEKPFGIEIQARSFPRPTPRVGVPRMPMTRSGGGSGITVPSL
ncbi:vWA domain-containing protein [Rhodopirellula sp. P2]|uniref:vWA domain-containing protein n=1 Tax=Rhodopirellula sp. P2 TaxID=2127060 RepID=UPI002368088F|nr:vWA domain-containing protein [Rhodopirellula sp. P2]WDQ15974.1 VWA domain-containing protein [Rhodopirellula sp. P2]